MKLSDYCEIAASLQTPSDLNFPEGSLYWLQLLEQNTAPKWFRIVTSMDAVKLYDQGEEWIAGFIKHSGPALLFPLTLFSKHVGFGLRSLSTKKFSTWAPRPPIFYTPYHVARRDFTFGTPIIVVEGVPDAEVCSMFYPFTVAVLTAGVTERQAFALSMLTNYVVLSMDNDATGRRGASDSRRVFGKFSVKCLELKLEGVKDFGDFLKEDSPKTRFATKAVLRRMDAIGLKKV